MSNPQQGKLGALFNKGRNPRTGSALSIENARLRHENDRLKKDAITDTITGIGNKHAIDLALQRDINSVSHQLTSQDTSAAQDIDPTYIPEKIVFCFIDLELFKKINDKFGHAAGDAILRRFGQYLNSQLRSEDTCGRLGGDEFAVVAKTKNAEKVEEKLLAIRDDIDQAYPANGGLPKLPKFSIGFATFDRIFLKENFPGKKMSEISVKELINAVKNKADENMYTDKAERGHQRDVAHTQSAPGMAA